MLGTLKGVLRVGFKGFDLFQVCFRVSSDGLTVIGGFFQGCFFSRVFFFKIPVSVRQFLSFLKGVFRFLVVV